MQWSRACHLPPEHCTVAPSLLRWLWVGYGVVTAVCCFGTIALAAVCPEWEEEGPLFARQTPSLPPMSPCTIHCAAQTYYRLLRSRRRISVLFSEALQGPGDQFCWFRSLSCKKGERLTKAFVVLEVALPPEGHLVPFQLLVTLPIRTWRLRPQQEESKFLGQGCGARFEVTKPFLAAESTAEFCVKTVCRGQPMCDSLRPLLKCPPFLVTRWRSPSQSNGLPQGLHQTDELQTVEPRR
ncbi:uncharacterized protein LOC115098303 [Rhinatrema bivittatum]|uniref:uncharacterized protein LOC115098303 n=1 Tax=Rhinatrema bivittatum TaxID=194408 RepID=UPI0011294132|nr:uncharacterized protein LOC115098303 [Rhinatrema bivittatum]